MTKILNVINNKKKIKLKVASDSMKPILKKNELIEYSVTSPSEIKKFDIIVYSLNETLYTHFVWGINPKNKTIHCRKLRPLGAHDPLIKFNQLLGIVDNKLISFKYKLLLYIKDRLT